MSERPIETTLNADQIALLASATQTDQSMAPAPTDAQGNPLAEEKEPVGPENGDMLKILVAMAAPAMPFLPDIYTPEVCDRIGGALQAVEDKYGWDLKSKMGPEFMLALVTLPPTFTAIVVGRQYFANERAKMELQANAQTATGREDGTGAGN